MPSIVIAAEVRIIPTVKQIFKVKKHGNLVYFWSYKTF